MASDAEVDHDDAVQSTSCCVKVPPTDPPKTPPRPSRAISLPTSTPISNKVSGSHSYSSQVKDKTNVALANEIGGHFLGAMSPLQFLDEYLPLKAGITSQALRKDQLRGHFDAVASAGREFEMYEPFVEALKPLAPGMVFVDTHSNPDTERDRLAPDIAGYYKEDLPEQCTTDFPKMSTFIELKKSENADPFCDPGDPFSVPPGFLFERSEQVPMENRGQIASYAAALSGSQFRVHVFSVSLCGKTARFIRWDRAGAIVTRRFSYVNQPHLLADFFWRYSHLDHHQQGYDLSVSVPSDEEVKQAVFYESRLKKANSAHREFCKLMVPARDGAKQETPFLISSPPYYESRSPFSRATRGMLAFDLTAGELVRMTLNVVGQRLTDFESSHEFIGAIADAMEAHDCAFFDAKILHRDISVGNILITDDGKGILIDWDLCVNLNRDVATARRPSRTGTWQFMSAALLGDPSSPHKLADDRESAFYVLLWTALRYTKHTTRPKGSLSVGITSASLPKEDDVVRFLRAFDEVYANASGDMRGGDLKVGFLVGKVLSNGLQFTERPELDKLVAELKAVFKVRYEDEPDPEQFDRLEKMKALLLSEDLLLGNVAFNYTTRLTRLRERGWLVNTIRKHLQIGEWPIKDRAEHQNIVPKTASKRKFLYDQANLEERASKRPSSGGL